MKLKIMTACLALSMSLHAQDDTKKTTPTWKKVLYVVGGACCIGLGCWYFWTQNAFIKANQTPIREDATILLPVLFLGDDCGSAEGSYKVTHALLNKAAKDALKHTEEVKKGTESNLVSPSELEAYERYYRVVLDIQDTSISLASIYNKLIVTPIPSNGSLTEQDLTNICKGVISKIDLLSRINNRN